ncbi:SoxR reducing system RseC family protein [Marinospirillum perlucidum]|uniref:SoxR reducing system RseC family protein n=1 Tax=Marinospirillum perlucidum TaxID=1982602 RepID=UPI000DF4B395|nr:SoxR reducing system RseC family protein [Marinospirillum perlucidum]
MIPTQAEVIRDSNGKLAVQANCQTSCKSCGVKKVCGGSKRSMLMDFPSTEIAEDYFEGQQLQVELAEEELLRLTLLAYFLPCLFLVVLALVASPWGDLATALGGVAGLALGVLSSSWITRKRPPKVYFYPLTTEMIHEPK